MPLKIIRQDITKIQCDAIVNPTDRHYSHGGGADADIHNSAGEELYAACIQNGILEVGKAVITPAFDLPCKYVIHTVGPIYRGGGSNEPDLLRSCYSNSLRVAEENGVRRIAFPSISTGIYHYPLEEAAKIAVTTAKEYVAEHPDSFELIEWVCFDDRTLKAYEEAIG